MKKIMLLSVAVLMFTGMSSVYAEGDELIKMLTSELGVTSEQAMGGAGALFNYAKEELSTEDFDKVSEAVPDMKGYLDAIPALGGGSGTGLLGKATESLVGMPAVTAAFDKLGLSQEMVGMFSPILVNYVDEKGGEAVSGLLSKVFSK